MKRQLNQPIKLVVLTIVFAYMLSFIPKDTELFGIKLKHVDILKDLKSSQTANTEEENIDKEYQDYLKEYKEMMQDESDSLKDKGTIILHNNHSGLASFSFLLTADVLSKKIKTFGRDQVSTKEMKIIGNKKQLKYFFDALKKTKTSVVRIAHFGDSGIEGDLMTADFREHMQSKFGGKGVGWVSITKPDAPFRMSTKMSFSDNWESAALYTNNPKHYPLGISGEIFVPKGNAWTQYKTTYFYPHTKPYKTARLFYSNASSVQIQYAFDGNTKKALLKNGDGIKELKMKASGTANALKISVPGNSAYYYGVSLENGNGIYIDNFPLRGNSGVDLNQIPVDKLKDFAKYLDYKLIILEFGLNAIGMIKRNYKWYVREMVNVIKHLKKAYPKASFLMVGVHDKSVRRGGKYMSDPTIFKLLKAQFEIVKQADIAYWNLFEAMGGKDSMHKWVTNNPPLASHDHLHFNLQGAKIISKLLMNALLEAR